jgi:hypothetical protein
MCVVRRLRELVQRLRAAAGLMPGLDSILEQANPEAKL